ncbi:MAG: hypothetical protein JRI72_12990 [Deltaproteobacteria bacterium]|nr:hypothetical protein [Deltaproteobacteria bacterium]
MIAFFTDTNLFLQCIDIKDLPWNEISEGEDVTIIISRPVMEEVDRLKHDGNKRRAKRARKASSLLRKIILSDECNEIIKESGPSVVVSFSPTPESNIKMAENLDLLKPDDRIINDALSFRVANPEIKVRLLTHDTNPLLTAKSCGLDYTVIPEHWLLHPEPDARDKKIIELEREIQNLKKLHPKIDGIFQDRHGSQISTPLGIIITLYEELSDRKIDELISECQSRYPMVTDFKPHGHGKSPPFFDSISKYHSVGFQWKYEPPSDSSIEEYKTGRYPQWLDDLKEYFKKLYRRLENLGRCFKISFILTNSGLAPAEHTLLEISASEGILFVPPKSKDNDEEKVSSFTKFPEPPSLPKGKWVKQDLRSTLLGQASLIDHFQQLRTPVTAFPFYDNLKHPILPSMPESRDRNAFYWKNRKPSTFTRIWEFECDEFRHKVDSEVFEIEIFNPNDKNLQKGAVIFRVSARNLPKPFELILPVRITYEKGDTESKARDLIKKALPKIEFKLKGSD